ncbi:competence protein CoiA family protein [Streptomyces sp. NPDC127098]|uniref:competence protein CoiA family protein n=1 Tax=Streptomyces sp. NPDC127098 TaxID=3347137 RepID=UPI00365D536A
MVFVGVHDAWGRIDVTRPDLGCDQDRASIHKTKPPAPLTCYECGWQLHLVHKTHAAYDLWFLRHANKAPHCATKTDGEGLQHHLLKLDLAHHARAAGWTAEYEVPAADGAWRADVLATSPDGARRVALEAQMASISVADITARTARYRADGIEVCWFTDRKTIPWLGDVPAAQIARPEDDGPVQVTAGPARFVPEWCEDRGSCGGCQCESCAGGVDGPLPCGGHGTWQTVDPFPLDRFVRAICTDATRPHQLRTEEDEEQWRWITRRYFELEEEQVQAQARREQAVDRLLARHRRQATDARDHQAAIEALLQRQKALTRPAVEYIYQHMGRYPRVAEHGTPEFAMGVPVYLGDAPCAVICPVAGRIPAVRERLAGLILFAATERERDRIIANAQPGQRIEVLEARQDAEPPSPPDQGITIKAAVHRMLGLDRM